MDQQVIIALTKGRILKETLPLLAAAGIEPAEDISKSRKLIFDTNQADIRLLVINNSLGTPQRHPERLGLARAPVRLSERRTA